MEICDSLIVKVKEYRLFVIVFDAVRRQPCRSVRETSIRLGKCRFRYIYSQRCEVAKYFAYFYLLLVTESETSKSVMICISVVPNG